MYSRAIVSAAVWLEAFQTFSPIAARLSERLVLRSYIYRLSLVLAYIDLLSLVPAIPMLVLSQLIIAVARVHSTVLILIEYTIKLM